MRPKINLTTNSVKVLQRRYLIKNNQGEVIETPEELFLRVAKAIALSDKNYGATDSDVEQIAEEFYAMMVELEFMPNSPTLMNAGRPLGQLSACFVLPIEDTMESIFDAVKNTALIHKSGGGTGFSFSKLRPKNSVVASTSGVASGPISFMKVINAATEAVKQGGTRRGANMGILRVDHPDILDFICCKDNLEELNNFNISVAVTDDFMKAVENDEHYDLIDPRNGKLSFKEGKPVRLKAREVFDLIVEHAWKTGEPGVLFIDRVNQANPLPRVGEFESTNPCGEQPLFPYESCNLGSINLSKMLKAVVDPSNPSTLYKYAVDWEKLSKLIRKVVHFLDNVIDANQYPLPEIEKNTKLNRKIGLGVMGWADMLIQMEIPYNSPKAIQLAEEVMGFVQREAHSASAEIAKVRGNFPNWNESIYFDREKGIGKACRNATVTTIAPTGTISIIAGCSSGIEPLFAISYVRTVMDQTKLIEVNPYFEQKAKNSGFYSEELMEKIASSNSLKEFEEIPQNIREVFVTAHDVSSEWHIRMQAAFQKFTDNAVSKTINLPNKATAEEVRNAYKLAFDLGCKGITIYRDGSREAQVLSTKKEKAKPEEIIILDRPDTLPGFTEKVKTGYGNLYITVNTLNGKPFEVFAQIGKSGYSTMADTEAICRLISLALRSGISVDKVIEQLLGIGGAAPVFQNGGKIMSIPDAIAKVLKKHFGDAKNIAFDQDLGLDVCPDCGGKLTPDAGCIVCAQCGYSKC
jgi:ribonucleoside-diphosphate reductase alpha chain